MSSTDDAHQISLVQLVVGLGAAWTASLLITKLISLRSALKSLRNCPGNGILLLHPFRDAALIGGRFFPFNGTIGSYYNQFSQYRKYGSTCLSSVILWGSRPVIWTADPDVFQVVSLDRSTFMKDTDAHELINIYGDNIIGTEGAEWKRHRDVVRSAFNEANSNVVWEESIRATNMWFDTDLAGKTDDRDIDLLAVFSNVALLVISSAGFGQRVAWTSASSAPESDSHHLMNFSNALTGTLYYLFYKSLTPTRVYQLSQKIHIPWLTTALNNATMAFESLRLHMLDIVSDARAARTQGAKTTPAYEASQGTTRPKEVLPALLANLVEANMSYNEDGVAAERNRTLTDGELLSNTFVFLLAGLETSAHTLCFVSLLLALHPEKQEKVFREVTNLWPNGAPTSDSFTTFKESMPKLEYTTAVIREAIRMFPPGSRLARLAVTDTCVKAKIFDRHSLEVLREVDVPIKAGTTVMLEILALNMNPLAWGNDVEDFKPERFIDTDSYRWPREAFGGFSFGPRNCIGQRFALAETVCVVALLIRRFEVLVPVSLERKTLEEKKSHMLAWVPTVTMTPVNAQVRVKERNC